MVGFGDTNGSGGVADVKVQICTISGKIGPHPPPSPTQAWAREPRAEPLSRACAGEGTIDAQTFFVATPLPRLRACAGEGLG